MWTFILVCVLVLVLVLVFLLLFVFELPLVCGVQNYYLCDILCVNNI